MWEGGRARRYPPSRSERRLDARPRLHFDLDQPAGAEPKRGEGATTTTEVAATVSVDVWLDRHQFGSVIMGNHSLGTAAQENILEYPIVLR